ncbi:YbaB/EbfC family nucleoid-associated protein [Streptoalloteichus hindustanus]|uniref:YbaB/EbfC DNA-binding family protein n=1 Tax=Streptoalloteichus hindustanus TaxID=2017 RepID=A0A1M5KAG1_STRHI|nr:YbaB/EbfC family nucleoid-associated protein [Streptoalloteichus hindustanus]SHG49765.1 YbaB/EbfC DNA-binding family protein [Streptoalloteichus hindustanus]
MSEDLDRQVRDAVDRAAERVAATQRQVADRLAGAPPVTGRASSADGAVTVVVAPGGMLRTVEIGPAAMAMGPEALAREVVELAGKATRNAAARMHASLRGVLDQSGVRGLEELGLRPGEDDDPDDDVDTMLRRVL